MMKLLHSTTILVPANPVPKTVATKKSNPKNPKSQLVANARISPPSLVLILSSLLTAPLKFQPTKTNVLLLVQLEHSSWEKTARKVLKSHANVRDQNASGSMSKERPSMEKKSPSGPANKSKIIFIVFLLHYNKK